MEIFVLLGAGLALIGMLLLWYGVRRYRRQNALHAAIAWSGHESLAVFVVLQAAMMFCFGLIMSNFSSMAMDPVGRVAGTAASFQGFVTTVIGALLGFYIGQHYDGTAVPLTLGYAGLGAL
ncbi:MAG: MFS transporter, partial [Sphingomonadales bacterium]